eukprot:GHVS01050460.1.p1 GENE.GHVS01050460.1~~GHVS01050460.1.p1  ORF type:complete len:294 (+),score=71.10 GHVS01050460.1:279-1160(+)
MKLNLANPLTGLQKIIEVDDEKKLLPLFEKRMGTEVSCDSVGDEFKGYVFRISGGNDKQGFPMLQGVLVNHRVKLLFRKGMKCFRPRRDGQKKRKAVRGCIVGPDLAVLNLVLVKKGPEDIPGLTDGEKPRRLGPKRASHIRKLFNLTKEDDVRQYVIRRKIEGKPNKTKAPKIQRLVTASRLQRKRRLRSLKIQKVKATATAAGEYKTMMENYKKQIKAKCAADIAKKKKAAGIVVPTTGGDKTAKAVVPTPAAKGAVTASAPKTKPTTTTTAAAKQQTAPVATKKATPKKK